MLWASGRNGNFSRSSESTAWMPVNSNYLTNNVQRQSEVILRFQQLTSFRRNNFVSDSDVKAANYLFHYVHEGEIVLERYFTRVGQLEDLSAMKLTLAPEDGRSRRSLAAGRSPSPPPLPPPWLRPRASRAADKSARPTVRHRFVLFANLASTARTRDFRDKFHLGSIKVTSVPKRMRDFLYFRSLKLDAGEAIIAQVE